MRRHLLDPWRLIISDLLYFALLLKDKQSVSYPELARKMSTKAREESKINL